MNPSTANTAELHLKTQTSLYNGVSHQTRVGRYHSLRATPEDMPADLNVTATTDDGTIMSIEHQHLPIYGVQYHPESIMSAGGDMGFTIMKNFIDIAFANRGATAWT